AQQFAADADDEQQSSQGAHDGGTGWQIFLVRNEQAEKASDGGHQPANQHQITQPRRQKIGAYRRNDQVGENQQHSADSQKRRHHDAEECIKNEIPPPDRHAFRDGTLRIKGQHQKSPPKQDVDEANRQVEMKTVLKLPLLDV